MTDEERDRLIGHWLESAQKTPTIAGNLAVWIAAGIVERDQDLPASQEVAVEFDAGEATVRRAKRMAAQAGFARTHRGVYVADLIIDPDRRPLRKQVLVWQQSRNPAEQIMAHLAGLIQRSMTAGDGLPSDEALAQEQGTTEAAANRAKLRLACFPGLVRMSPKSEFFAA